MSTELRFEPYVMPGVPVGPENPLPDIKSTPDLHANIPLDPETIYGEDAKYFGWAKVKTVLPYTIQDGYTRDKKPMTFLSVVLENDYLKATFIPALGGRLWSLKDKVLDRDLVQCNPVFQPANLAVRNAWFSGGVEWNIGFTGHTPYTCSPLFSTTYTLSDGTPALRMYEWERIRQVSYQIDAFLPADSKFLYVRVSLHNTRDVETPIYWWSNIAVNETEDTRVLCPADRAYNWDYTQLLAKVPVPYRDGIDRSYTTRVPRSMDMFFDIPKPQRKWEAALDKTGTGLVQTSTDLLQGRKLFLWGNSVGGGRWQEFLSVPGQAYLEIQAGLAHTQMEHLPMPAKANWKWLEAYGTMQADPTTVHGESWQDAYAEVDAKLESMLPRSAVEAKFAEIDEDMAKPVAPKTLGSGWAALEALRLAKEGKEFAVAGAVFAKESLTTDQAPWIQLLETGVFATRLVNEEPAAYLVQAEWMELLEASIAAGKSENWHAYLQLGIMKYANEDLEGAKAAWNRSLELERNAWALRNLAMLLMQEGRKVEATDMLLEAVGMLPILQLAIETAQYLNKAERYDLFPSFMASLPGQFRPNARLRSMEIEAAIMRDEFDFAKEALLGGIEVNDMREGEVLLSDLWIRLHERKLAKEEGVEIDDALKARVKAEFPIPAALDFRMVAN